MRTYFVPIIPALTVLALTSLGAGAVASSPELKDGLASVAAFSGGGLAVAVAAVIALEDQKWGGDSDEN